MFMMALATAAAWCMSRSPNHLGVASQFLDSALVFEAGDVARASFEARHKGFQVLPKYLFILERHQGALRPVEYENAPHTALV